MALSDFGKGLRDKLQGAVQSTKEAVEGIDLSGVKDKLQETGDAVKETVKKVGIPKKAEKDLTEESSEADEGGHQVMVAEGGQAKEAGDTPRIAAISTRNAIKVIYYLMAADGTIYHGEQEKFDSIASELDPNFVDRREQILVECQSQLDKVIDPEDYCDVLQDGVEDALASSRQTDDTFITPKLLVWDLLTVAYSDESYDDAERRLIKYVVRKTGIDKALFLEMESSILTLRDIEGELSWIKTTDRPYLVIEGMVNELVDRRSVIFESVKDLISL